MRVTGEKAANLKRAEELIQNVCRNHKPDLVVLPECFNSPYGIEYFRKYSEIIPTGETSAFLQRTAIEHKIYLVGGSISECSDDKSRLYNTCTVYSPLGQLVATHRKVHLFDINIPGKMVFQESKILQAGERLLNKFDTPWGKIGIGICYDLRFPEMALLLAQQDCKAIIYPAAFNTTTGPLHWELLLRSRAVDTQSYVIACSPARNHEANYPVYGHSMIADPWGKVVCEADIHEEVIIQDLDNTLVSDIRQKIPVQSQRRRDLYSLEETKQNK